MLSRFLAAAFLASALLTVPGGSPAHAADSTNNESRKKKKPAPSGYALIAGTVFKDPGFAVPGAEVTLKPAGPEGGKKQTASTNFRGEFTFRVPPVAAKFDITVLAKGLKPETKPAATQGGEERIDVTFLLSPESK